MENYVANGNQWIYNARDPSQWNVIYFDPCPFMGFPNQLGISVIYNGIPIIIGRKRKTKFPWVIFSNRLQNNY